MGVYLYYFIFLQEGSGIILHLRIQVVECWLAPCGECLSTVWAGTSNRLYCVCVDKMSVRTNRLSQALRFYLHGEDNQTLEGTLILDNIDALAEDNGNTDGIFDPVGTEGPWTGYDQSGASLYAIVVIAVYGFSIVLLIGSHIFLKKKEYKRDGDEQQIDKYLRQVPSLKEKSKRDSFKKLKLSIIPLVNAGLTAGLASGQFVSNKALTAPRKNSTNEPDSEAECHSGRNSLLLLEDGDTSIAPPPEKVCIHDRLSGSMDEDDLPKVHAIMPVIYEDESDNDKDKQHPNMDNKDRNKQSPNMDDNGRYMQSPNVDDIDNDKDKQSPNVDDCKIHIDPLQTDGTQEAAMYQNGNISQTNVECHMPENDESLGLLHSEDDLWVEQDCTTCQSPTSFSLLLPDHTLPLLSDARDSQQSTVPIHHMIPELPRRKVAKTFSPIIASPVSDSESSESASPWCTPPMSPTKVQTSLPRSLLQRVNPMPSNGSSNKDQSEDTEQVTCV